MSDKEDYVQSAILHEKAKTSWNIIDVLSIYAIIFVLSFFTLTIFHFTLFNPQSFYIPALIQTGISFIAIFSIYLIITKKYNLPFTQVMGLSSEKFPDHLFTGIFISFLLVISTSLITFAFNGINTTAPSHGPYSNMPVEKLRLISMMAVFIAPFFEETFFRGFMQPALTKNMGMFGGIFLTALIFGLSHAQYLNYGTALISVTAIGLILGITREKTGSITPCIVAHLLNNLYASMNLY